MNIKEIIEKVKEQNNVYKGPSQVALFLDKEQNLCFALIVNVRNLYIVNVYNEFLNILGYFHLSFFNEKVSYLDVIYTYHHLRGLGIGKQMSNLMDYILKSKDSNFVYGSYMPQQLSDDKRNDIYCSQEELENRAANFYTSTGFHFITAENLKTCIEQFPELNDQNLKAIINLEIEEKIVYKRVDKTKDCKYKDYGDVLIHEDVLKLKKEKVENIIKKSI